MKLNSKYRILSIFSMMLWLFMLWSFVSYAQSKQQYTVELDTLSKVIGIAVTLGGFFLGYMQMRMANKMAEVEARFNSKITDVKDDFTETLHTEIEKLEGKLQLSQKEIENKMATKGDIASLNSTIGLQHENVKQGHDNLKEQLKQVLGFFRLKNKED